jgi:superfamily I DNA/RNA helicase
MTWTTEQEEVFDFFQNSRENGIVEAVAGSGKTTTIQEGLRRHSIPGGETLAIAFSADVKKTFEKKLPKVVEKKTFNGLGHGVWAKKIGRNPSLDQNKLSKTLSNRGIDDPDVYGAVLQVTGLLKQNGVIPPGIQTKKEGLFPADFDSVKQLADFHSVDFDREVYEEAMHLLEESIKEAWNGIIDFNDQLYMPTVYGAAFRKYSLIVVDEAQDLSPIQHEMLTRSKRMQGRIIAVGDSAQAIYGFRGAHTDSMELLRERFSMHPLSLSISFRCSKNVVAQAQHVVGHIRPQEDAPQGAVWSPSSWTLDDIPDGAGVICRVNAPLLGLAYRLLQEGRAPKVLGRDIGKGLSKLVNKLAQTPADIPTFLSRLKEWERIEIERARMKEQPQKVRSIMDKAESLKALANPEMQSTRQLVAAIEEMFNQDKRALVTLSTIHKAKGAEFDNVFVLDHSMVLPPYHGQDWEQAQEANMRYVAYTRAITNLWLVESEDLNEGEEQ